MKTKTILTFAVGAFVAVAACGEMSGFSAAEKERIKAADGDIMQVLTIDRKDDSLLLRGISAPMDAAATQSTEYPLLRRSMLATVRDSLNPGVGIAAPQVGIFRRMIAVQRFDKPGEPFEFYLNPEIVEFSSERAFGGEGCLSVPDLYGEVERSQRIALRYRDEEFKEQNEVIEGFTAVIFQHEIDHLDGILYIDRQKKE